MAFKRLNDRGNQELLMSDLNNTLNMNHYYIKDDDVNVTISDDLEITIGSGTAIFDKQEVSFSETQVPIKAGDESFDRIDIIVLNNTGVISLIEGIPNLKPVTPIYDADNEMCLCSIRVRQLTTKLIESMVNPNFIIRKTIQTTKYENEYYENLNKYQRMEVLELTGLTTLNVTNSDTIQIVNEIFPTPNGLLQKVNTDNTTCTHRNYYYSPETTGDHVEIDLPTVTGTYTHTALFVDYDKAYNDIITYNVIEGANVDDNLPINTKNIKDNVTSNPTKIRVNLIQDGEAPVPRYPKLKGITLIIYK